MLKPSPLARVLLHLANLVVIAFFLLPLFAVVIGSVQSERTLQAATRAVFPPEYTLDNFRVILSGGTQKGAIFEQVTYLPGQHQAVLPRLRQQHDRGALGDLPDAGLRRALGLHGRAPALALDALADAGERRRALRADHRADDPALRDDARGGPAELAARRDPRAHRLPAALRDPDPRPLFPDHPVASSRTPRGSTAARASPRSCASRCRSRPRASPPAA